MDVNTIKGVLPVLITSLVDQLGDSTEYSVRQWSLLGVNFKVKKQDKTLTAMWQWARLLWRISIQAKVPINEIAYYQPVVAKPWPPVSDCCGDLKGGRATRNHLVLLATSAPRRL